MKLTDLPHEILSLVAEEAEPDDFDAFLATCRRTFQASQRHLPKHKDLKARYGCCILDEDHPATLLHAIWKDARVARYVKTLEYTNHDPSWHPRPTDYSRISRATLQQIFEYSADLARENSYLSQDFGWHEAYHDLEPDVTLDPARAAETPAFVLLLSLLPNVTQLKLVRAMWDLSPVSSLIRAITCSIKQLKREAQEYRGIVPLSKLRVVTMRPEESAHYGHSIGTPEQDIRKLMMFATLPSIQRLAGYRLDDVYVDNPSGLWGEGPWRSSLQHLEISDGNIGLIKGGSHVPFVNMLAYMPALKTFKYHHHRGSGIADDYFKMGNIATTLLTFPCASNIRHLCLAGDNAYRGNLLKDLRGFRALKTLELSPIYLFERICYTPLGDTASDNRPDADWHDLQAWATEPGEIVYDIRIPRLVGILPESLEYLSVDLHDLGKDSINSLLEGFPEDEDAWLPALRTFMYGGDEPLKADIQNAITRAGIKLKRVDEWTPDHDERWLEA